MLVDFSMSSKSTVNMYPFEGAGGEVCLVLK